MCSRAAAAPRRTLPTTSCRWSHTPTPPLHQPQAFYESQQSTTRGFMRMAVSTLSMLKTLVENGAVRQGFMHESVVGKAAGAVRRGGVGWAGCRSEARRLDACVFNQEPRVPTLDHARHPILIFTNPLSYIFCSAGHPLYRGACGAQVRGAAGGWLLWAVGVRACMCGMPVVTQSCNTHACTPACIPCAPPCQCARLPACAPHVPSCPALHLSLPAAPPPPKPAATLLNCFPLQVERPEQYHFNRDQLLVSMVYFTVRLAEQPAFVQAVSAVRGGAGAGGRVGSAADSRGAGQASCTRDGGGTQHATTPHQEKGPKKKGLCVFLLTPPADHLVQVPDYDETIIQRAVQALSDSQLGEYEHRRRLEALAAGKQGSFEPAHRVLLAIVEESDKAARRSNPGGWSETTWCSSKLCCCLPPAVCALPHPSTAYLYLSLSSTAPSPTSTSPCSRAPAAWRGRHGCSRGRRCGRARPVVPSGARVGVALWVLHCAAAIWRRRAGSRSMIRAVPCFGCSCNQ